MPSKPYRSSQISRRTFLELAATSAALVAMGPTLAAGIIKRDVPTLGAGVVKRDVPFSGYPFKLGIASGDPAPDGFVLWTKLAPDPLKPGGGMGADSVEVKWQVAEDEKMSRVVASGTALAEAIWGHSVHVEVGGLKPDRWYWYQFKAGKETTAVGRTRTMPAAGATVDKLKFAFASCQKYEVGYFTAFDHLAREDIDLVVHLGDYIYEKADDLEAIRPHGLPDAITLDDYRIRYALYKSDPALQAAHAVAPWIVTWDDHEVSNDYAGVLPAATSKVKGHEFMLRRAAGYQAYYENMPLRKSSMPSGPDMLLYRRLNFGALATFNVLDTREYRSDRGDAKSLDPSLSIMGKAQRDWLFDGLSNSTTKWNVLAQQVMMARVDVAAGPKQSYYDDKWPGYEYERRQVLKHIKKSKVSNPVVITGDIHHNWANELLVDFDKPDGKPVSVELVGTSISSDGDGGPGKKRAAELSSENPFVKYYNGERGYVRCEVTAKEMKADFRTVPYVTRRGAPISTNATFVIESGSPVLNKA